MKNKRLYAIFSGALLLLLIPLIAMIFTREVNWSFFDFVVAGFLLLGSGICLEFILRKFTGLKQRLIFGSLVIMVLFIIWAELAVGVFNSPLAGS